MKIEASTSSEDWRHSQSTELRAQALVESMSLAEKVDLVTGDLNYNFGFYNAPIERVGIPALAMADGPPGIRINNGAVHQGKATALPAPISLAASWDLELAHHYGKVLGAEARASGHNVFLGPAADIARVAVGGRTFESSGEDPLLNARFAAAQIKAVQSCVVLACLKHFAVNNQEYERASVNVQIDERTLRELYLRPFEAVVRSTGVASLMGAFNRVNGIHSCENPMLLSSILRKEWGFRGWVMSDYGATHSTIPSAIAGLDQEQPSGSHYGEILKRAVVEGDIAEETVNAMCMRIVRTLIGLGVIDRPLEITDIGGSPHRQVAQKVAERGTVLLKNDGNLLPLDPDRIQRLVVVGVDANNVAAAGGGSGKVKPAHAVSLLDGLRERLGDKVQVDFAQGADPITAADLLPGLASIPSGFLRVEGQDTPGVRAEYWTNTDFVGAPFTEQILPQVALNLGFFNFPGFGAPSACFPQIPIEVNGRISARFTGRLTVPVAGQYRLGVTVLGSVRVFIDDVLVLDFRYHGPGRAGGAGGSGWAAPLPADDDVLVPRASPNTAIGQHSAPIGLAANALQQNATAASGGDATGVAPDMASVEVALEAQTAGHRLRVEYAADAPGQGHHTGAQIRLTWETPQTLATPLQCEAVALAAQADAAVVVVRCYESEHMDRPDIRLPNSQADLIRAVAAVNPNTVVITMSGGPVETLSWEGQVRSILHAWYAGQEQGTALARILFGDVSPSGRLPVSFPRSDTDGLINNPRQYPGINGNVSYLEQLAVGYRGFDLRCIEPRFAFGHGLSYTQFSYTDLQVRSDAEGLEVSCWVQNTGDREGIETLQLYLGLPVPDRPPLQLADWCQLGLAPGQTAQARFRVEQTSVEQPLSIWSEGLGWEPVRGEIRVYVGASARDIRLQGVAQR